MGLAFTVSFQTLVKPSSESQGQLEGAGKKFGRRKVKNEEKSPWGQGFNGSVPNDRSSYKAQSLLKTISDLLLKLFICLSGLLFKLCEQRYFLNIAYLFHLTHLRA